MGRPVKGDQRNDLFEGTGLKLNHEFGHARRFDLEHAFGIAIAQELIRGFVIERDLFDVKVFEAGFRRIIFSASDINVNVFKPRKSNLMSPTSSTQPCCTGS